MTWNLRGVSETMLIPLWARAVESINSNPIIRDKKALAIISKADYDFSGFRHA